CPGGAGRCRGKNERTPTSWALARLPHRRSTVDLQLSVTPVASDYMHYTYTVPDCQYAERIFTCQSSADSVVQATILAQVRLEQEARKPLLSLHNVNRVQAVFHAQVAV